MIYITVFKIFIKMHIIAEKKNTSRMENCFFAKLSILLLETRLATVGTTVIKLNIFAKYGLAACMSSCLIIFCYSLLLSSLCRL